MVSAQIRYPTKLGKVKSCSLVVGSLHVFNAGPCLPGKESLMKKATISVGI